MKKRLFTALLALVTALTCFSLPAMAADKFQTASLERNEVTLNAELYTESYSWKNWNNVSPISDFVDNLGRYTIAYTDDKYVYISHISDKLSIADTIKIKNPMPLIGGVTCDDSGNFYIACGQRDEEGKQKISTFSVAKYSSDGKYIASCDYYPSDSYWDTQYPFDYGNCAMAFQGDLLVCSYARKMYSGHQSNAVFCVNTTTMTEDPVYDSYCSHSFNQAVLPLGSSTMVFADHGDAHPRGFSVNVVKCTDGPINGHYSKGFVPFHFSLSGDTNDMFNVNYTNSRLTGIAEVDTGIVLVGSSGDYEKETPQQMFLQIIDPDTGNSVLNGARRSGNSSTYGGNYTDTGIIWLTDYTDGSEVRASAMAALDSSRLLVMWERWNDGNFVNSYYSIVSSDGKILKEAVPMQKARINGAEELKIIGDKAYWTYADNSSTATIYRLDTSATSTDVMKEAAITLSWTEKEYTGKALKPTVTVKYEDKTLKSGTDYTVSYKNNTKPGIASVTIKGKGKYGGSQTVNFHITPKAVQNFTVKRTTTSKNTLSWSKSQYASGYEIRISKYEKSSGSYYYWLTKEVTKNTSKTTFTHTAGKNSNVIFHYCVRPYIKVNGEKIYGEWSEEFNPYW